MSTGLGWTSSRTDVKRTGTGHEGVVNFMEKLFSGRDWTAYMFIIRLL